MKSNHITQILVPLDFSESSLNALDTAIAMAKQNNASVTLLHVVDPSFMFGFKGVYCISEKTIESIVDISARRLNPLVKKIKEDHALKCTSEIKVGLVPQSITQTAFGMGADLIVMGTHGASGIRKFFIGSSAEKVVKIASCPVLTIPSNRKWVKFKKILFPIRAIAGAIEKYDFVKKLIPGEPAAINLLVLAHTYNDEEKKFLRSSVKELKTKALKDGIKVSGTLKLGENMPRAVLKMSKYTDPDMIILTSSAGGELKQFFLGPFEQHVINHARGPVLSIKPQLANHDLQIVIQQVHESLPAQVPILA